MGRKSDHGAVIVQFIGEDAQTRCIAKLSSLFLNYNFFIIETVWLCMYVLPCRLCMAYIHGSEELDLLIMVTRLVLYISLFPTQ